MLSAPPHSSGSSGSLRCQRLIRNQKNSVAGKLGDELLGVRQSLFGIDIKLPAHPVADNLPQRRATVGGLKDGGCYFVQREEGRIGGIITIISPASARAAIAELRAM